MKPIILAGAIFLFWNLLPAQILTVTSTETGKPVDLALVNCMGTGAFATTNAKGEADISGLRGCDSIRIMLIGYESLSTSYQELEKNNFTASLKETFIDIDEVVVSATRWNQPRRDIPAKIATISRSDVALQNPQTAADLLGTSGEVFIQKSQLGGGSPMIRGFSTNRLLIAVDGIRMNNAIFRSGNLQNVISLDPFAVEHTEVFFGPGSVIYGSDAIGGVMSFLTLPPDFSLSDKALVTGKGGIRYASAANERTAHFDINVGWRKWSLVTSLTYTDYDDLRMGANGPEEYLRNEYVRRINGADSVVSNSDPRIQVPTGYNQLNLMQKVAFRPSTNWDLSYAFHFSKTSDIPRYDRLIEMSDGSFRNAEWNYGPQEWLMHAFSATHQSNGNVYDDMTVRLAYQRFGESRIDRRLDSPDRRTRTEAVDAYSGNFDFVKRLGISQTLFYGAELVYNDVSSEGEILNIQTLESGPTSSRYPASTWTSIGAYASYQNKLSEKVLVSAGLRYSYFILHSDFDTTYYPFPFTTADLNNGALTGSAGFVYHPGETWTLSANISTGFRAPNVDDVGKVFDSEPGSVVVPNPDLQAEYAYNFEIGMAKVIKDRFKFDMSAYYTILNNAMVRRPYSLNGQDSILYDGELSAVEAVQNAARATVYGVQAGIEFKLPAGFGFSSVFNYQKGEEELDDGSTSPSRHAPPAFGQTHLTYRRDRLTLDIYSEYSAKRKFEDMPEEEKGKTHIYATDENGNPYAPGWYTLNAKALYQASDLFGITVGLENITNQRYRPYSSGIVAPGLNFITSVRVSF